MTNIQVGSVEVSVKPTTITDITTDVVNNISVILGEGWDAKAKHDVWVVVLNGLARAQLITVGNGSYADHPRDL